LCGPRKFLIFGGVTEVISALRLAMSVMVE